MNFSFLGEKIVSWVFDKIVKNKEDRQKKNLEQYDRKLNVYKSVKKFLSIVVSHGNVPRNDLYDFHALGDEADFLFGPEIKNYIDEVYKHANALQCWNDQYCDSTQIPPKGYDSKKITDGMGRELEWFSKQFGSAKEKFRKYLDIAN